MEIEIKIVITKKKINIISIATELRKNLKTGDQN